MLRSACQLFSAPYFSINSKRHFQSLVLSCHHNFSIEKKQYILSPPSLNQAWLSPKQRCAFSTSPPLKYQYGESSIYKYLSECAPTAAAKDMLVSLHDVTGLHWWSTIILSTFILRSVITLPLALYQAKILAKVENLTLVEMPEIAEEVKKETTRHARSNKWTEKQAQLHYRREVKKKWDSLIIRDNCHPFKATITVWFQLPTWIFFSCALRNLAYKLPVDDAAAQILFMQLSVGGLLWIPNLTQPDGTLILPILLGFSNLAIIEMQSLMRLREPTRFQRYATNFFRVFSVALIPIAATVPADICLYWTTSSLLGLMQNLLLMSNRVKGIFRIPETPSTLDHPYLQLVSELKQKGQSLTRVFGRR